MHRINLKGPWDVRPIRSVSAEGALETAIPMGGTVKFPATWQQILGDFRGAACFSRHFNKPTNLEPSDHVILVLDGVGGAADVRLNDQAIGQVEPSEQIGRFDITPALCPHNVLEITIDWHGASEEPGGLWGPVALEIVSD